jgi:putative transposase
MTVRMQLDDRQWAKVEAFVRSERGRGRRGKDDRRFIEGVLWIHRTGAPWRDLPDDFGPWSTVFNRFDRWSKHGKWTRLFKALQSDIDDEWSSLDATIVRAHQHAAGGKGGPRSTRSGARVEGHQRRSTWSSTRWGCLFRLRSPRDNATTASEHRS